MINDNDEKDDKKKNIKEFYSCFNWATIFQILLGRQSGFSVNFNPFYVFSLYLHIYIYL